MTGSLQQLKEVQQKFVKSQETLTTITPDNAGKDILLPLTSSVSFLCSAHMLFQYLLKITIDNLTIHI